MSLNFKPHQHRKPRLAITVGDLAGIGPELALKCAANPLVVSRCQPILIGPIDGLRRIANELNLQLPPVILDTEILETEILDTETQGANRLGTDSIGKEHQGAYIMDCGSITVNQLTPGQFSTQTGLASFQAVELAIKHALSAQIDAIVTGPIQKEAWHDAGTGFLGHTELLAERTGTSEYCMMLAGKSCSTVLASIHRPIADAIRELSSQAIEQAIRLGGMAKEKRFGRPPRITVLGLNPHAGEGGLLSHGEEEQIIQPAIDAVAQWSQTAGRNWKVTGPVPPDTAFTPSMREATDVHICMYHDQGLIPLKALSFDDAVNVTLGLPIVRTSVDHGTALDLAWKGIASENSMLAAIDLAIQLCH